MHYCDDCILFLLSKAHQNVYGQYKKRLQSYGLTPSQHLVIFALSEAEGVSAGELGKRLTLDNATLSGILDRLSDGGWIVKESSEEDKRSLKLYLTPKAKEHIPILERETDDANEEALSRFGLEEKVLFKRFLKDMQR
ncbi:MAG: MarR family transcriptional regulator [Deltaproteobacteria bacterium]|nr:MarR family transcriptional regulator [Deltaproteobacteria bacterium]